MCVCKHLDMASSRCRGAVDILEGTAQRRPFQFVVKWIGDTQSTSLQKGRPNLHPQCCCFVLAFKSDLNKVLLCNRMLEVRLIISRQA